MPCACNTAKKSSSKTYTVKYPNGSTYKTYSNEIEAKAAAARIHGTYK